MKKKMYNCPAQMTVVLIGGKWKAILLNNVSRSAKRFGELKRISPGVTSATLSNELKSLENSGLVNRNLIGRDLLSGVEYSLTEKGESLKLIINAMIRWGIANQQDYVAGEFGMAKFRRK